jgi:hypothetical protein
MDKKVAFSTAFKAAVIESLLRKKVITAAEKTAFKQKSLS